MSRRFCETWEQDFGMFTYHRHPFLVFYSPAMTEGLHRFYGANDLHFLTFSCYRRQQFF
jgi:hypothetical protein